MRRFNIIKTGRLIVLLFAVFVCSQADAQREYDVNRDGVINISDVVSVINYMADSKSNQIFYVNDVPIRMIKVEGGTFMMGMENGERHGMDLHKVTLSSYLIGETEVTNQLWNTVTTPLSEKYWFTFSDAKNMVSWYDCQEYISKLNNLTGLHFRLPTEAEWEYAARGGNLSKGYIYSGSNNLEEVGWYLDNSDNDTHRTGTKSPNELGIYDMSGNLMEWCQDWYLNSYYRRSPDTDPQGPESGNEKVCRGGSWNDEEKYCQPNYRNAVNPIYRSAIYGLRLVLSDYVPWDVNKDEKVDISDVVAIINMMAKSDYRSYDKAVAEGFCPDGKHPHVVDLGIGVKFSCCNLGADSPWDIGTYYLWGYSNGSRFHSEYKEDDIAGTEYDDATERWGSHWRMPNKDQLTKLITECEMKGPYLFKDIQTKDKVTDTEYEKIWGFKFTGPNGNSIFLPFAGQATSMWSTTDIGSYGYYLSSSFTQFTPYQYYYSLILDAHEYKDYISITELRTNNKRERYSIRPIYGNF